MFAGKDVATALGYSNTRKALQDHVDEEDKRDDLTKRYPIFDSMDAGNSSSSSTSRDSTR